MLSRGGKKKETWGRGVSAGSDRLASSMAVTRTRTIGREAVSANTPQNAWGDGWMGVLLRQHQSWTAFKHLSVADICTLVTPTVCCIKEVWPFHRTTISHQRVPPRVQTGPWWTFRAQSHSKINHFLSFLLSFLNHLHACWTWSRGLLTPITQWFSILRKGFLF